MELLLIRHLPTEWNKMGILQGSHDIPILPVIEEVALKINENKKEIADFNPEIVLASELMRTQQTAEQYGYNDPHIDLLVNELNFGEFEGVAREELFKVKEWINDPRSMTLGERLVDFEDRLFEFINKYNDYSRVLVFGHGSWIRGLISIERVGSIQKMNQVLVANNELFRIKIKKNLNQLEVRTTN